MEIPKPTPYTFFDVATAAVVHLGFSIVLADLVEDSLTPTLYAFFFLQKNETYDKFCLDAGVPVKAKCFRFVVTENAALKPGTPLTAMHFRPGQYVDCTAKRCVCFV